MLLNTSSDPFPAPEEGPASLKHLISPCPAPDPSLWGRKPPGHPLAALVFLFGPSPPKGTSVWVIYSPLVPRDPLDCPAFPDCAAAPSPEEKGGFGEKAEVVDLLGGSQLDEPRASPVAPAQQHPGHASTGHLLLGDKSLKRGIFPPAGTFGMFLPSRARRPAPARPRRYRTTAPGAPCGRAAAGRAGQRERERSAALPAAGTRRAASAR